MTVTLNSNITELPGVGDNYAKKLEKLGIHTIRELLFYFPRRWDDFSKITPIREVKVGEAVSVRGVIWEIGTKRSRKGRPVTEIILTDDTGTTKAVWFNQPFLEKSLKKGDEIFLAGTLEFSFGGVSFNSPAWEKVNEEGSLEDLRHVGRIVPVYSETSGLTSKWLRAKISGLAKLVYGIKDHLPEDIKRKHDLMELSAAVRTMHYPENFAELKKAQKRLFFDDLFCLFCAVLENKKENDKNRAVAVDYNEKIGTQFVESLPYKLTDSQRAAAWQILKDITKPTPMNRLLEGDVGSGKTVVAAMASLMTAKKGYQVALLAPTEILAAQHYESLSKILEPFEVKVSLLTGTTKPANKKEIIKGLADGDIHLVVGTHALLSPEIKFWTLALVVVDEQHRFGVEQREALKKSNENGLMPHFLSMSATPIPRTLAITVFGDLSISVLTEVPAGRQKVETFLVPQEKRNDGYKFIDEQIEKGRQVFVICPLVSSSDKLGVKSAEEEAERLRSGVFKHRKVGLIHGRLKSDEKEKTMQEFKKGKINILVSTSVIEVGIDVPNASIMLIEGAERFGLAQLHQFRGRVGRGEHKSYCFLFADMKSEHTEERMNALLKSENGFELAEKDLDIRGPGELLGLKQSGKIDETLLAAIKNPDSIAEIRTAAEEYLAKNNLSENLPLAEKVSQFEIASKLE
jgi:ATP-dependent DNA helicase RecG